MGWTSNLSLWKVKEEPLNSPIILVCFVISCQYTHFQLEFLLNSVIKVMAAEFFFMGHMFKFLLKDKK